MPSCWGLTLVLVLILSGCGAGNAAPGDSHDSAWPVVLISVNHRDGESGVVGDDGVTCTYRPDFPIKGGTEVRLRYGSGDAFVSAATASKENGESKKPGDACTVVVRFNHVPVSRGYLVEFPAAPRGPVPAQPTYDLLFIMSIYTRSGDFTSETLPNGGQLCTPKVESPVKPGATFRTRPEADPARRLVMLSKVTGERCVVRVIAFLPAPASDYAIAIGTFPLPGEGTGTPPTT